MAEEIPFEPFIKGILENQINIKSSSNKPSKIYKIINKTIPISGEQIILQVPKGYFFVLENFFIGAVSSPRLFLLTPGLDSVYIYGLIGGGAASTTIQCKIIIPEDEKIFFGADNEGYCTLFGFFVKKEEIDFI